MERQAEGPLSFYQRFLRITFRTFRCSCARAPAPTHVPVHMHSAKYTHIYTRTRVLFPFCPPPLVPPPPSTSCPILLHPPRRSPSATLLVVPRRLSSSSSSLLYVRVHAACTCVRAPRLNRPYARFHVARLCAPAARGRLCTWVNGKMSFETFLGRSRSPHCQSYTREICRSRENARRRRASFRSTMPVGSTWCPSVAC